MTKIVRHGNKSIQLMSKINKQQERANSTDLEKAIDDPTGGEKQSDIRHVK